MGTVTFVPAFKTYNMHFEQFIQEGKGTIVDVRSRAEFAGGHVAGSINIPLQEIPARTDDLRGLEQPVILCCASGGRSGQAHDFLRANELDCYNAGSWLEVNFIKNNTL